MSLRNRKRVLIGLASAGLVAVAAIPVAVPGMASGATPAALDTCRPITTNSFVSLEVAPEISGKVPISAGYHRLWDMAVAWKDVNPAQGQFVWTTLDQRVAQAEQSGAVPMLVLGLTPRWAAADPNAGDPRWGLGTASPPANIDTWRQYVQAVVQRYGTRIGAYEVWNEANLQTFWTGTPAQMAQLTKTAFDTIKATNKNAIVMSASVTTRLRGPMSKFVTPYVQALGKQDNPIDGFAIHTYPAGNAGPAQRVSDIQNWQAVVTAAAGKGSPLLDRLVWDTEVNYGLAGPGTTPPTDYTDAQGAALINQTFSDSLGLGIDATFWYLYTAAPFDLLGVQLWSGTPQSLAMWEKDRSTYSAGANLCASAPPLSGQSGSSTGTGSGGNTASGKSITIEVDRVSTAKVDVSGTSKGLGGQTFVVYCQPKGKSAKEVGGGTIKKNGSYEATVKCEKAKGTKVFVKAGRATSEKVSAA